MFKISQQRIDLVQYFPVSVDRLFAHLSEHENMARVFAPARVKRVSDGVGQRNGVTSSRSVKPGPLPAFIETVTAYQVNELIEYRITKGSPFRNHVGLMRFADLGPRQSRVEFSIVFEGRFVGIGPIFRLILNRGIARALVELAKESENLRLTGP